jgi:hypothetical protein
LHLTEDTETGWQLVVGGWAAAEVMVAEAVAVALQGEDCGVGDRPDSATAAAEGSAFNRRQGVSIEPASIGDS